MKTLHSLRDDPDQSDIQAANDCLGAFRPDYFERYGPIGSDKWWSLYDADRISRTDYVGQVSHIGLSEDSFGETEDIVRITTDRGDMKFSRGDFFLDPAVALGVWIHVETIKAVAYTKTGPVVHLINTHIWLDNQAY